MRSQQLVILVDATSTWSDGGIDPREGVHGLRDATVGLAREIA